MADRTITVGDRTWTWTDFLGWTDEEGKEVWGDAVELLDEVERLRWLAEDTEARNMALASRNRKLQERLAAMIDGGGDVARSGCPNCTPDRPMPSLRCVRCGAGWWTDGA